MIPEYKQAQPQLLNNVTNTITYLQQSQDLVSTYVKEKQHSFLIQDPNKTSFQLSIEKLKNEPHLDLVLFETLKEFGFNAWNDIKNLLDAQSGKKVMSETHTILKNRTSLLLYKNDLQQEKPSFEINIDDDKIDVKSGIIHIKNTNSSLNLNHLWPIST